MTEVEKELLVTILASEVAGIASNSLINKDLYDKIYNFLFKNYMNADENTLHLIQKQLLN